MTKGGDTGWQRFAKRITYYGALLSALVNGGLAPALFEKENGNRQIYEVTTNKASYIIYTKYNTTPSGSKDFVFTHLLCALQCPQQQSR